MDYVDVNRVATFGSGSGIGTQVCQSVTIVEDTVLEYDEDFSVVISEEANKLEIESGRNVTVVTIMEDEDSKASF